MEVQRKAFFATPQEAEAAFYEARARGDIESMMAVWGDEDDIVCALAGCPRACGYDEVRDAWRRVFAGTRVDVRQLNGREQQGGGCHQRLQPKGGGVQAGCGGAGASR